MSKDIVIRRNDTGEKKTLVGVKRLKLNSPDILGSAWVPADETDTLAEVNIGANGHYTTEQFGAYGIGIAHVNVDPYAPVTVNDVTYQIYLDSRGKPHISVSRNIT